MDAELDRGINGPFVRSGWAATSEPQSAVVYAERVTYDNGEVEFLNVRGEPFTEERFTRDRTLTYRSKPGHRRVMAFDQVSRTVMISATSWE